MKIILTNSFCKSLQKIRAVSEHEVCHLIDKYPHTSRLVVIDSILETKILKGYLASWNVRMLVLFQMTKGKIIPVSIVKKISTRGKNIMKKNYIELFGGDIDRAIADVELGRYKEIVIDERE